MNINNIFFYIQPAHTNAQDQTIYWSPSQTFAANVSEDDEVVVIEAEENWQWQIDDAEEIARYSWPAWRRLWQELIGNENLADYDLSGWDNEFIEKIAVARGELLIGTR